MDDVEDLVTRRRVDGLLVELDGDAPSLGAPDVARVRRRAPSLPIIGACRLTRRSSAEIVNFVHAGGSAVLLRGYDDPRTVVQRALREGEARRRAELVLRELEGRLPEPVGAFVREALRQVGPSLSVESLAAHLGMSRRGLAHWTARHGAPPPSVIVAWCRVLMAAQMLHEAPRRRVADVAQAVGLGSEATLRTVLRRLAEATPSQLRRTGLLMLADRFGALVSLPAPPAVG